MKIWRRLNDVATLELRLLVVLGVAQGGHEALVQLAVGDAAAGVGDDRRARGSVMAPWNLRPKRAS